MEGATLELETGDPRMEMSQCSIILKCDPIPGASGDHVNLVETRSNNASYSDSTFVLNMDVQPLALGDCNKLHITTEGVSVALPRNCEGTRGSTPHILAAEGTGSAQEGPTSTSGGRNLGPPASSGEETDQDGSSPRRSFQEFLPLLLFAIGTVAILRVAAHRGKIPKA